MAVVTQSEALLFVDSRYWIAAEKAMDPSLWTLRKFDPRAMVEGGFQDYLCNVSFPALPFGAAVNDMAATGGQPYRCRRSSDTPCAEGLPRCQPSLRLETGVPGQEPRR